MPFFAMTKSLVPGARSGTTTARGIAGIVSGQGAMASSPIAGSVQPGVS
jgi:hypothetical protein